MVGLRLVLSGAANLIGCAVGFDAKKFCGVAEEQCGGQRLVGDNTPGLVLASAGKKNTGSLTWIPGDSTGDWAVKLKDALSWPLSISNR